MYTRIRSHETDKDNLHLSPIALVMNLRIKEIMRCSRTMLEIVVKKTEDRNREFIWTARSIEGACGLGLSIERSP